MIDDAFAKQLAERKRLIRLLSRRSRAYQRLFSGDYGSCTTVQDATETMRKDAEVVLTHLRRWAKIGAPAYVADDPQGRASAMLAGRQEAVMQIISYLSMSMEDALKLNEE